MALRPDPSLLSTQQQNNLQKQIIELKSQQDLNKPPDPTFKAADLTSAEIKGNLLPNFLFTGFLLQNANVNFNLPPIDPNKPVDGLQQLVSAEIAPADIAPVNAEPAAPVKPNFEKPAAIGLQTTRIGGQLTSRQKTAIRNFNSVMSGVEALYTDYQPNQPFSNANNSARLDKLPTTLKNALYSLTSAFPNGVLSNKFNLPVNIQENIKYTTDMANEMLQNKKGISYANSVNNVPYAFGFADESIDTGYNEPTPAQANALREVNRQIAIMGELRNKDVLNADTFDVYRMRNGFKDIKDAVSKTVQAYNGPFNNPDPQLEGNLHLKNSVTAAQAQIDAMINLFNEASAKHPSYYGGKTYNDLLGAAGRNNPMYNGLFFKPQGPGQQRV